MEIDVSTTDAATVVQVTIDIDARTAPVLQDAVLPLISSQRPLILDMSRVSFMSSAGLRVLLMTYRAAKAKNARLLLCGLSEDLKDTMSATGFLDFFVRYETLAGAFESLR